jgi:hypothetical protein
LIFCIKEKELNHFKGDEKDTMVNLIKTYFSDFTQEQTLYDHLFYEMEKKYTKEKTEVSWEDHSHLSENYLYLSDQFSRLYLKFISIFFPDNLKREALIMLHRFPFSKVYFNYIFYSKGKIFNIYDFITW